METADLTHLPPEIIAKIALTLSPAEYQGLMRSNRQLHNTLSNSNLIATFALENDLPLRPYVRTLITNGQLLPRQLLEKYYDFAVQTATHSDKLEALFDIDEFRPIDWENVASMAPHIEGTKILDYLLNHNIDVNLEEVARYAAMGRNIEKLHFLKDLDSNIDWNETLTIAIINLEAEEEEQSRQIMDIYRSLGLEPDWRHIGHNLGIDVLMLLETQGANIDWDQLTQGAMELGNWELLTYLLRIGMVNKNDIKSTIEDGTFGEGRRDTEIDEILDEITKLNLDIDWEETANIAMDYSNVTLLRLVSHFIELDWESIAAWARRADKQAIEQLAMDVGRIPDVTYLLGSDSSDDDGCWVSWEK